MQINPALARAGFQIYESGSAFYVWARIPEGYGDAMRLNETLMSRAGVAGVPGSTFADSDEFDDYMRFSIAREDRFCAAPSTNYRTRWRAPAELERDVGSRDG